MNWIQVLLIGSIMALLVFLLRSRRNARSRAWVTEPRPSSLLIRRWSASAA